MSEDGYRAKCFNQKGRSCIICGGSEDLQVHHLDGDRTNNSLENLVPLCRSHHTEIHNGESELADFLQSESNASGLTQITVRLPSNDLVRIEDLAEERGKSRSDVIREFVSDALNNDSATQKEVRELKKEIEHLDDERKYLRETLRQAVE